MKVSIIIPALNEAANVGSAVRRAWATGPHEVIVADGGSQDRTGALARAGGAKLVETAPGRARQQNGGAMRATGDVFLFQHADNWLDRRAVRQIVAALANPVTLGGAFHQHIEAPGRIFRLIERGNARRVRRRGLPFGDQGIFLRRAVFESLGGFPEAAIMEDLLLMRQLRKLARPVLLPGPIHVSARRWQRYGVVRQTLRNWLLQGAEAVGVSPGALARYYPCHNRVPESDRPAAARPVK